MARVSLVRVCVDYPIHRYDLSKPDTVPSETIGGRIMLNRGREFVRALDLVSLNMAEGNRVALLGSNGSGKSTLLKTIGQILPVASGERIVEGRVVTLFSTGAGIDAERSGIENIHRLAALHNVPRSSIPELIESIEDFSELGQFMKLPVKAYSAGMRARLGFAFVTSIKADIVLIDEVIGVGDKGFYKKAQQRLSEFMTGSGVVVIASHSMEILKSLCTRAFVLRNGRIAYRGPVRDAITFYNER